MGGGWRESRAMISRGRCARNFGSWGVSGLVQQTRVGSCLTWRLIVSDK